MAVKAQAASPGGKPAGSIAGNCLVSRPASKLASYVV